MIEKIHYSGVKRKMKKGLKYLSLVFGISIGMIFVGNMKAQAAFGTHNGSSITAGAPSGGTCGSLFATDFFCRYSAELGTRISVIYYDGSTYQVLGNSFEDRKSVV